MKNISVPNPKWIVGKNALMNLHAVHRNKRTEVDPKTWRIPFQWMGYHYQDNDDQPFVPLVNTSGGFVEGDSSELHVYLEAGTRTLLTTTSAAKFYKCEDGQLSHELIDIILEEDALCEYLPDETILYAKSKANRQTVIDMHSSSHLFATDTLCAGRIHYADGESFAFDYLCSSFEIRLEGEPFVQEKLLALNKEDVQALKNLWRGNQYSSSVYIYSLNLPSTIQDSLQDSLKSYENVLFGVSRIQNSIIVKFLSQESWQIQEAIFTVWQIVRPCLAGKPARQIRKC